MLPQSNIEAPEIMVPDPIAFSFEAIGWSILFALLALVVVLTIGFFVYRYYKNRYRREAIKELSALTESGLSNQQLTEKMGEWLKIVAMYRYGRLQVAGLFGEDWLSFLLGKYKRADKGHLQSVVFGVYNPGYNKGLDDKDYQNIVESVKKWIKHHG
ncbi:DUF4381 domain-containing protein [Mangrovibacterium lignilyticum]|uniref:DUF4381 domain-containing protein n=1 Tax=Mangrovibacterium lignilyticum TaxID=2668052 RepID=UPI0013D1B64D|nr:DUF4381 domain-containing protein [Mangrovibacterium lignilyticum]